MEKAVKVWVHISGTTSKSGLDDFPKIELLNEEQAKSVIMNFVDEEIEQTWSDTGQMWDGTVLESDRITELMEVILEGEDTLFAKVSQAKDELTDIVWKEVLKNDGFHYLYQDYGDGWFWSLELKEFKKQHISDCLGDSMCICPKE